MAITTSNTAGNADLVTLIHEFYAVGERIVNLQNLYGVTNTALNGICTEIKGSRSGNGKNANSTHVAILAALAGD